MDVEILKTYAHAEALDVVGAVPVGPTVSHEVYRRWLEQGYAGEMARYLGRPDAVARRADPRRILPQTRSVLVVGVSYAGALHLPPQPLHGRVSRYAWGEDYHRWLLSRLQALVDRLRDNLGDFPARCYVDTGPILERDWARRAGLGWLGKNTTLIHPRLGSYVFLGVALVGVELPTTPPESLPTCGTCTRCLEACPTGALVAPWELDARRCLAYLTIEHRGAIPKALRPALGTRLFGCDVCQSACPWNREPLQAHVEATPPPEAQLYLPELLTLDAESFRARYRRSPIWRATPQGLARNAAVALGNLGDPAARPYLAEAAKHHSSPLVREHAVWALHRLG